MATQQTNKPLTPAQREHFNVLISQLAAAENELNAAQRIKDTAQNNANGFIVYCASEQGVPIGREGWEFSQAEMRFVQRAKKDGGS